MIDVKDQYYKLKNFEYIQSGDNTGQDLFYLALV